MLYFEKQFTKKYLNSKKNIKNNLWLRIFLCPIEGDSPTVEICRKIS